MQAAIALARLDLDAAYEQARRAIAFAEVISNPTLRWKTHALLGDVLLRMGRAEAAHNELAAAVNLVEEVALGIADHELRRSLEQCAAVTELRERLAAGPG